MLPNCKKLPCREQLGETQPVQKTNCKEYGYIILFTLYILDFTVRVPWHSYMRICGFLINATIQ